MEFIRWVVSIIGLLLMGFFTYVLYKILKLMLKKHDSQGIFVCFLGGVFIVVFSFFLIYGLVR